jgi:hypothetical protein
MQSIRLNFIINCERCPHPTRPIHFTVCDKGYGTTSATKSCSICDAGYFSAGGLLSPCQACPIIGHVSKAQGSGQCSECPPGSFADTTASSVCTPCPIGQYNGSAGAVSCGACLPGSSTSTTGSVACSRKSSCLFSHLYLLKLDYLHPFSELQAPRAAVQCVAPGTAPVPQPSPAPSAQLALRLLAETSHPASNASQGSTATRPAAISAISALLESSAPQAKPSHAPTALKVLMQAPTAPRAAMCALKDPRTSALETPLAEVGCTVCA